MSWANLADFLFDIAAILIVTVVVAFWALRLNRYDPSRRPRPGPRPAREPAPGPLPPVPGPHPEPPSPFPPSPGPEPPTPPMPGGPA